MPSPTRDRELKRAFTEEAEVYTFPVSDGEADLYVALHIKEYGVWLRGQAQPPAESTAALFARCDATARMIDAGTLVDGLRPSFIDQIVTVLTEAATVIRLDAARSESTAAKQEMGDKALSYDSVATAILLAIGDRAENPIL